MTVETQEEYTTQTQIESQNGQDQAAAGVVSGKKIPISLIKRGGGTQNRVALDEQVVQDYTDAMNVGATFPPVIVFFDTEAEDGNAVYWLADGFHRVEAASRAGLQYLLADVRRGSLQDAQWFSYAANKQHGLRRSTADKQKAVRAALLHPTGRTLSDRQIGDHVGVDHKTVAAHRAQLEASGEIPQSAERTGADGRTYTVAERNQGQDQLSLRAGGAIQQLNDPPQNASGTGVNTTYGTPSKELVEAFRAGAEAHGIELPETGAPAFEEIQDAVSPGRAAITDTGSVASSQLGEPTNQVTLTAEEETRIRQEIEEKARQTAEAAKSKADRFAQAVEGHMFLHATDLQRETGALVARQMVVAMFEAMGLADRLKANNVVRDWLRSHDLMSTTEPVDTVTAYPTMWIGQAFDEEGATVEGVIAMAVRLVVECTITLWGQGVVFNSTHLSLINQYAKKMVMAAAGSAA